MSRPVRRPDANHPITVEPTSARIRVRVGDTLIADSTAALVLKEASYPPVYYLPRADVTPGVLRRSDTTTYCPFKGDAGYFSVDTAAGELTDAVWTYEQPYPAVGEIAGYVAFYPNKVELTVD